MALTSRVEPTTVELEHEPGQWIKIRPVPHGVLRDAAQLKTERDLSPFAKLGPEAMKALQREDDRQTAADRKAALESDPDYEEYERGHLLVKSIVAWSYTDDAGAPIPVTPEDVADLDDVTAKLLYRRILELNVRTREEGEVSTPG